MLPLCIYRNSKMLYPAVFFINFTTYPAVCMFNFILRGPIIFKTSLP